MIFHLAEDIKVTLVTYAGEGGAIKLDCSKKRVYWLVMEYSRRIGHIKLCNYRGGEKKTITSGSINRNLLGVFGDSFFFLNTNVSNRNNSRTILVEQGNYQDLLVVDNSLQPTC